MPEFEHIRCTYSDLEDKLVALVVGLQGVQNEGNLGVELDYLHRKSQERFIAWPRARFVDSGWNSRTVDDGADDLLR